MTTPDPKWSEMADAIIRLWKSVGWQALAGAGVFILAWKFVDSWGKRK